jgi:hypothetical protein
MVTKSITKIADALAGYGSSQSADKFIAERIADEVAVAVRINQHTEADNADEAEQHKPFDGQQFVLKIGAHFYVPLLLTHFDHSVTE